jgi:lipocalin-like protein
VVSQSERIEMIPVKNTVVLVFVALITSWSLFPSIALADDVAKQLVGTWKLTAWVVQVIGEDSREPYGPNPKGRLVITPEGHWITIITGANRRPAKTADEKAALLDSVIAYSGKYTIEGNKITIRVDMSSNEIFTGANQDQTRLFKIEGDILTVRTPEIASAALPGKRVRGTNTFERER